MLAKHATRTIAARAILSAIALLVALGPTPAKALSCATEAITARGEPSRYAWTAKAKARANWRAKVRATSGLGASYANWARAQNTDERCLLGPANTLCIFTGLPCRP